MKNCPPGGVYDQLEGTFKRNPADSAGHQTAGGRTACQTHVVSHRRTGAVFAQPSSAEELAALLGLTGLGGGEIEAGAGETLSKTAVFARNLGLTGLEFAHGIPGTVGGGIYMNAGAYGGEMKQAAVRTTALSMDGAMRVFSGDEQGFSYRTSAFENLDMIIVKTVFRLLPGQTDAIAARMQSLMEKRRASQPLELPSAGSTFKRPEGAYAGALIEQAQLKGVRVGGACVSEKHAGFVVNTGGATAQDVRALIALIQKRVFETSGFHLQPEVRIW